MADISHIKGPDNTSYDIKDATARSDISNKVSKSGDTMSGYLKRTTTLDPSGISTSVFSLVNVVDVNDNTLFDWSVDKVNQKVSNTFRARRMINNVYRDNYFTLLIDSDGNPSINISAPSAWRSALELKTVASSGDYNDLLNLPTIPVGSDYVLKAGDTMSGDLTMQAACIREDFRNSAQNGELSVYYNEDKASYSTQSVPREYLICTRDKNNWIGAYLYQQTSNQGCRTSIGARTYWSNGDIVQNMYFGVKVGTPYETPAYEISHPKLLLDNSTSIGKLTSGTGTKTNNWTNSGGVTCTWVRSGHVVSVEYSFSVSLGSGSSLGRWTTLFTGLPKSYTQSVWVMNEGGAPLILTTNGEFQIVYVLSNSTFFRGTFTYLTDDFN